MAEGKKTFIFYSDWINMVSEMPDIDAGILLKHILNYVNDQNPTTDNPLVKMAFGHMKPLIKSDLKKWELIREKRKEAGAKGGKRTQAIAKQMLEFSKQVQAVNDNVNVSNIINKHEEFKKQCLKDDIWKQTVSISIKLKTEHFEAALKEYNNHIIAMDEPKHNLKDYKQHFVNWSRKQIKQQ